MSEPKLPTCHWARDLHGETEVWTKEDMQAFYAQARTDTLAELVPVAWIMNGFHVIDRKGVADTLRRAGEKIEQLAVIPKA